MQSINEDSDTASPTHETQKDLLSQQVDLLMIMARRNSMDASREDMNDIYGSLEKEELIENYHFNKSQSDRYEKRIASDVASVLSKSNTAEKLAKTYLKLSIMEKVARDKWAMNLTETTPLGNGTPQEARSSRKRDRTSMEISR